MSLAVFDPSIVELKPELQTLFQHPVEFILTNVGSWAKIFDRVTESIDELLETITEVKASDTNKEESVNEEDIGYRWLWFYRLELCSVGQ